MADFRPEDQFKVWRADSGPERPVFRPKIAGLKSVRSNERKFPGVLQDFVPFEAAAQKPIEKCISDYQKSH